MSNKKSMVNKPKTKQLSYWQGVFGNDYIQRNSDFALFEKRKPFFEKLLKQYSDIASILEVGCNIGGNLKILHDLSPKLLLFGIEPNKTAAKQAQTIIPNATIKKQSSFDLHKKNSYDLVFTAGVLIHIADKDLKTTLTNMHNASKKYLLTIEYFSKNVQTKPYHDLKDALFKRPYDKLWLTLFPQIMCINKGFLSRNQGFDDCHWWLFEK